MSTTAATDMGNLYGSLIANSYALLLGALLLVAAVLGVALIRAIRRGRADKWVATITGFAVLALSAEGMWVVATERLGLPPLLAATVFFVAEAAMVSSAMRASRQYERTAIRDEAGNVVKAGTPGKHGRAVWVIATVSGAIVALNSKSYVEVPLRLVLPLAAAYLWWNALTADGVSEAERSSWRWTPRRLLLWIGAIEAGERDARQINRDRQVETMTTLACRVHLGSRLAGWHESRLRRLARRADDDMIAEVQHAVWRTKWVKDLTDPRGPEFLHAHSGGTSSVSAAELPLRASGGTSLGASDGSAGMAIPELPAGTSGGSGGGSSRRKSTGASARKLRAVRARRPAEETRQLAAELRAAQPAIRQVDLAKLLGISARQLRNVERVNGYAHSKQPDIVRHT